MCIQSSCGSPALTCISSCVCRWQQQAAASFDTHTHRTHTSHTCTIPQDTIKQQDWKIERLTRDNRALEAANCELRTRVDGVKEENLQVRVCVWGGCFWCVCQTSRHWCACVLALLALKSQAAMFQYTKPRTQVSEKILALDEECRALRLAANEADARAEALSREKGQLQELAAALRGEVADKMALLDEFEAKFARQYR